jgi:hypothetical protein
MHNDAERDLVIDRRRQIELFWIRNCGGLERRFFDEPRVVMPGVTGANPEAASALGIVTHVWPPGQLNARCSEKIRQFARPGRIDWAVKIVDALKFL